MNPKPAAQNARETVLRGRSIAPRCRNFLLWFRTSCETAGLAKGKANLSDLPAEYGTNLIGLMPCLLHRYDRAGSGLMFFLIRCAFWLAVVFNAIFTTDQGPVAPSRQPAAVHQALVQPEQPVMKAAAETRAVASHSWLDAILDHWRSKAVNNCAMKPEDCAGIAARLADFARQHPFDPQARSSNWAEAVPSTPEAATTSKASAPRADVPLPPARPRHLMRSAHARFAGEHFSRS